MHGLEKQTSLFGFVEYHPEEAAEAGRMRATSLGSEVDSAAELKERRGKAPSDRRHWREAFSVTTAVLFELQLASEGVAFGRLAMPFVADAALHFPALQCTFLTLA